MIDTLLSLVAPHHCSGCGENGTLLCDNCKYDIVSEPYNHCLACGKAQAVTQGICANCNVPYARGWCVADRRDQLERLINLYKFGNAKAAYKPLAALLHERLPELPANAIVVPIPTVSSHVRERGFDHMALIARHFAKRRGIPVSSALRRVTSTKQRDASRTKRIAQAKVAFECPRQLDREKIYLLLDDVMTTGSTMRYAAQKLRRAGAEQVWIATISRQPLD